MCCIQRKYGVGTTIPFSLIAYETSATSTFLTLTPIISAGDTQVSKDSGAFTNIASNSGLFVWVGNGQAYCSLSATEMQAKQVMVTIIDTSTPKLWKDQAVFIETYGNSAAQHPFDLGTETQSVNLTQIDGQTTVGNNATLNLKQLNIVNNAGVGIIARGTTIGMQMLGDSGYGCFIIGNTGSHGALQIQNNTSDGPGIAVFGAGAGQAIYCQAGPTGDCIALLAGAGGNTNGIVLTGYGSGDGAKVQAGATGSGLHLVAGATSGNAIFADANVGNGIGIKATGHGTGAAIGVNGIIGINIVGSTYGVAVNSTGGDAIYAESTLSSGQGGNGIFCKGSRAGAGLFLQGGDSPFAYGGEGLYAAQGNGGDAAIRLVGVTDALLIQAGTNGNGINCQGYGTGSGAKFTKGVSGTYDIQAAEIQAIKTQTDKMVFTGTGRIDANIKAIDEQLTSGANATLNLKQLNINNNSGSGIIVVGTNDAVSITATTGTGLFIQGYSLGASIIGNNSTGMAITGGGSSGNGLWCQGYGTGSGIYTAGGSTNAAHGIHALGGSGGGVGIKAQAQAGNNQGLLCIGFSSGQGAALIGGAAGDGMTIQGSASSSNGLNLNGGVSGLDISAKELSSIIAKLPVTGLISNMSYTDVIDATGTTPATLDDVIKFVLCMTNGKFEKDVPSPGDVTFYARDNVTPVFKVHVDTDQRTRLTPL